MQRRNVFLAAAALVAALALPAILVPAWAADRKADEAELTRLSNNWDKVIVAKQEKAIADNMAEDFRIIDGHGNVENKAQFVAGVMDAKLTIDPYTVDDFDIRIYGDVALLSGRTRMTGAYDGKPFKTHYRYIDVYVRQAGSWRVASVQITRVKEQ